MESVLLYGSEVWGCNVPITVERLQLKFFKELLRVKKSTPSDFIYLELGLLSIRNKIKYRMICFWTTLINPKTCRLSQKLYYKMLSKLTDPFLAEVRHTLIDLDLYKCYVDQSLDCTRDSFKIKVKTALFKLQKHQAYQSFDTNKSLLFKQLVKEYKPFQCAWYLCNLTDPSLYRSIASIRLRSTRLAVEVGGWSGVDFNARVCYDCNKLEDEFHLIVECVRYQHLREQFIDKRVYTKPSMFKLLELLNTNSIYKCIRLGIFLKKALPILRYYESVYGAPANEENNM